MGRATLIICTGVIVMVGYIGLGSLQQSGQIIGSNVSYAERLGAKNAARTVIQMAMDEMNNDPNWHDDKTENNPWVKKIDDTEVRLYVDVVYEEEDSTKFYEPDTLRLVSTARYLDSNTETYHSTKIIGVYVTTAINEMIESFKGALAIVANNVKAASSGPATVSASDTTGCPDVPAVTVANDTLLSKMEELSGSINLEGEITLDPSLSYTSFEQLINRLENLNGVTFLKSTHTDDIGTEEDPGVFFVEQPSTINNSLEQGYGIMVIRSDGSLAMEDSAGNPISVGENFTFNGLGIFEDAYDLEGTYAPAVNGTVVIGQSDNYLKDISIDLNGYIRLQYDCSAEHYAKTAAAGLLPFKRYRRISTFE